MNGYRYRFNDGPEIRIRLKDTSVKSFLEIKNVLEKGTKLSFEESWEQDYNDDGRGPTFWRLVDKIIVKELQEEQEQEQEDKDE